MELRSVLWRGAESDTAAGMLPASGMQVSAISCRQRLDWACMPHSMDCKLLRRRC